MPSSPGSKRQPALVHEGKSPAWSQQAGVWAAYLDALIESSPVAILVLDAQHRAQWCNRAFENLFLYSRAEVLQNDVDRLITGPDLREEAVDITRRVLAGNKVHRVTRRQRKDGSFVDVEVYGVPLIVRGELHGVYGLYQDITERSRADTALRQLSGRLLQLQDEERRRIARDLHDTTAQKIAAASLNLCRLQSMLRARQGEARELLTQAIGLIDECARELRSFSYLLHPPLLEEAGLRGAITWFVDGFSQRSGISVQLDISDDLGRFSTDAERALFRVLQEALANVLRHSGSATADVRLKRCKKNVMLQIADQGHGLPETLRGQETLGMGVGILGMRERLRQLGGSLEITSTNCGTTVTALVPAEVAHE